MVLPFSGYQKYKSQVVKHNVLAISSMTRARLLTEKIWIQDWVPTKVNLYIAHNVVDVTLISIEFRDFLDKKDIQLTINPIQAAKIVCSGYLLGSVPYMDKRHWCNIFNKHPKLSTIDVDIKHDWVQNSLDETWDSKKSI